MKNLLGIKAGMRRFWEIASPIDDFDLVRESLSPATRLDCIRKAAHSFRDTMLAHPPVRFYRSFSLVRVPYPTRYALLNACTAPTPYVHIVNRLFVVQFDTDAGVKTLLVSPSDVDANAETPFFKRLSQSFGPLEALGSRLMAPKLASVSQCLKEVGISPESVDYITYDHLHTQDLRGWLGTRDFSGFFPNARLLVMRREWESARGLTPPQADWYCPGGVDVPFDRVVLLDGDVKLGHSVALIRTPGHTEGNHSVVVHTPEGLMVTSENGIGPDAYAPEHSRIPGVKKYAEDTGMEVVLNGNTLERGLDQYLSMVLEKEIAGPSVRNPNFPNVVSSSELAAYWAFPGVRPTFSFGDMTFGTPVTTPTPAAQPPEVRP